MDKSSARDYDSFCAMDVHARSIAIATLDSATGEHALGRPSGCPGAADVAEWARGHTSGRTLYAYESGPTKSRLCRDLRAMGLDCGVAAASSLARSSGERLRKTDAGDARALPGDICSPFARVSWSWVPSEEAERARDLRRLWRASVADAAAARQAVASFLLGRGEAWSQRTPSGSLRATWGRAYEGWLAECAASLCPGDAALLADLRERVGARAAYAAGLRGRVLALGAEPRWRPYVDSISCLLGIGPETALLAAAEFDDFSRFRSGGRVGGWLGAVPPGRSSGESSSRGPITKAGPAALLRALVEGTAPIALRRTPEKPLRRGQGPVPEAREVARRGNRRLLARYRALAGAGKAPNKARVAVVAEEACWAWQVGLAVQASLG